MDSRSENNKRIAKNTAFLYGRTLFSMFIALYTSRIVLDVLGKIDFGIYDVVGGVVAMFTILSGSLSAAVSRFLTFELGINNKEKLKKIFSISILIHIGLAIIVFILAESVGLWFINNKMNIPPERMEAANWVWQCSIFTFILNLISVPYNAAIIAHERMKAFAYISILDVLLKLIVAIILIKSPFDNLILYAVSLLTVAIITRLIYGIYCKRNFEECTFSFVFDKNLVKEMIGFAGWNFIGVSAAVLRDQGVNIAINIFCGPALNTARAVSVQVNFAVNSFMTNFTTALNPQITKSYATKELDYMHSLIRKGSRFSFYLLMLLVLPLLLETEFILNIWLKEVPAHAVLFTRLMLLLSLIDSLSPTLITAMLATGKIRNYQLVVGGLYMLNFPVSYILLKSGFFPEITVVVAIILSSCCLLARLIMLRKMIELSARLFIQSVVLNIFFVFIVSAIVPTIVFSYMDESWLRFFSVVPLSVLCASLSIYFIGLSKQERAFTREKVKHLQRNIFSKYKDTKTQR